MDFYRPAQKAILYLVTFIPTSGTVQEQKLIREVINLLSWTESRKSCKRVFDSAVCWWLGCAYRYAPLPSCLPHEVVQHSARPLLEASDTGQTAANWGFVGYSPWRRTDDTADLFALAEDAPRRIVAWSIRLALWTCDPDILCAGLRQGEDIQQRQGCQQDKGVPRMYVQLCCWNRACCPRTINVNIMIDALFKVAGQP